MSENQNDQPSSVSRRSFVAASGAALTAIGAAAPSRAAGPRSAQDKVVVGVMGLSRGMSLATTFAETPNVEVKYLCETDTNRLAAAAKRMDKLVDYDFATTGNFKDILDDPDVDALVCAAPNHWHAPAAIMACNAGKHCYVEKPCSHNPWEGEMAIKAARKNKKCVQMGSQRRSGKEIQEAIKLLHDGGIGRVYYSRSWYANLRGPIGHGTPAEVPPNMDYELWQGPAPRQPYTSNKLPYNWHWFWHYGNGELGNNGVHSLDLARWGLQADYPTRVVSSGGRYRFDDDQETADTHVVSFQFEGEKQCIWEALSCNRHGMDGSSFGCTFHGEEGSLEITDWGYKVYDQRAKEIKNVPGTRSDSFHIQNFVDAIRADDPTMLNAEIEEGHKSTLLCHLGNIAHRTGDSLDCDPANGHILNNDEAMKLWKREYEPGWEPTV
ncbi:Gfo/Idh/MocA family protein [Fuerstiella marisgermanici]|uniref:Inositol 2-dehydrogenase n=1 Tax=Fuerstiella marisgermanici TaxID=1891926 RepID=A0A1P8WGE7_9PLAN|nr:Gfo/Idh/MocA family oxidoreductase [Fuerstiella marisgermanici]APZ93149.1 Inositol 2-dehydrogenase [Fuerstiella marisgermanici]